MTWILLSAETRSARARSARRRVEDQGEGGGKLIDVLVAESQSQANAGVLKKFNEKNWRSNFSRAGSFAENGLVTGLDRLYEACSGNGAGRDAPNRGAREAQFERLIIIRSSHPL